MSTPAATWEAVQQAEDLPAHMIAEQSGRRMQKPDFAGDVRVAPRFALTLEEAAVSLGMKPTYFESHVLPNLKTIRLVGRGRGYRQKTFVPVKEIERWIERNMAMQAVGHAGR